MTVVSFASLLAKASLFFVRQISIPLDALSFQSADLLDEDARIEQKAMVQTGCFHYGPSKEVCFLKSMSKRR